MTLDGFITLLGDDLGLDVGPADLDLPLDQVAGWDSVLLLQLVTVAQAQTAVPQSLPALLRAHDLRTIYQNLKT